MWKEQRNTDELHNKLETNEATDMLEQNLKNHRKAQTLCQEKKDTQKKPKYWEK